MDLSIHLTNKTGEVNNANCSIQIRNATFDTLIDSYMNNTNGGWYNFTYNTSKVGKYYCRQNCTLTGQYTSDTCDFIIQGDEKMSIAISIIIIGIAALFFVLAFAMDTKKHQALKTLFLILAMITILIGLFFAYTTSIDNGASTAIQTALFALYRVGLYAFVIFIAYIVIFYIFSIGMFMRNYSKR